MSRVAAALGLAMTLAVAAANADDTPLPPGFDKIRTIVVVYAENRSFVHLFPDHLPVAIVRLCRWRNHGRSGQ